MNWRPFLFVIGLFVLFRALGQLFGDSFDTFFVGGIVVLFFGGILYERSWWSNILDRLGRGSDEERRAIDLDQPFQPLEIQLARQDLNQDP